MPTAPEIPQKQLQLPMHSIRSPVMAIWPSSHGLLAVTCTVGWARSLTNGPVVTGDRLGIGMHLLDTHVLLTLIVCAP